MADVKEETKDTTATIKAAAKAVAETTFTKQQFIDNAEALGYSKAVVIGAFYYVKKDSFTKSEVNKLIDDFLKKGVK